MLPTPTLYIAILILSLLYVARRRNSRWLKSRQDLHPECKKPSYYPHYEPFLGLDLLLRTMRYVKNKQALGVHRQHHAAYGKTYVANLFGQTTIHTIEAQNFEAVYGTNFADWGVEPGRLQALQPFCGRGFITTDGAAWQRARSSVNIAFGKRNVDISQAFSSRLDEILNCLPINGQSVDLQPIVAGFFQDMAGELLVGEPFTISSDSRFTQAYRECMEWLSVRIFLRVVGRNLPSPKFRRNCSLIHSVLDHYIKNVTGNNETQTRSVGEGFRNSRTSLLDVLISTGEDSDTTRAQILQGIMATHDTTFILVTNTMFLLSRHPEVWERLRAEVMDVQLDNGSAATLSELKLLANIIKESLRLYPVFALNGRISLRDTVLPRGGGHNGEHPIFVAKGSRVLTVFYELHRDPKVFGPDVEKFDPDRWIQIKPGAWEYLPFSRGPRSCVGRGIATNQAAFVLAKLAQRYSRLKSKDDRPWAGKLGLTCANGNGCHVGLHEPSATA